MNATPYSLDLRTYSTECNAHSHDWYQLVLAVHGQLEMSIAHQGGVVSMTHGALVAPGVEHAFAAEGDNCFVVVDLPPALSAQLEPLPAWFSLTPTVNKYLEFLATELRSSSQFTNLSVASMQQQMINLLLALLSQVPVRDAMSTKDYRVHRVCEYMQQHLNEPITVAHLARLVHLGPRQLSTLFSRDMGVSIHRFLLELRMAKAQQLLSETRLSVQQVAECCGYQNLSAFSDRFRRHTGVSPRYFRSGQ